MPLASTQLLKVRKSPSEQLGCWADVTCHRRQLLVLLAEVAQSVLLLENFSECFRQGNVTQEPLLRTAAAAVSDAGHLTVVFCGFIQALVTVHMQQG